MTCLFFLFSSVTVFMLLASINYGIRFMNLRRILENDFNYQLMPSKKFSCQVL